ncbi:Putative adhesin [Ornithinibacillus halophilus]|uniref:Putative adhesin n=2 Tax=Ornithinibacillus halophilus TaxID=930117 RepID=A0A1M5KQ95_9BACI|nr:Putative adhesin [Ornithinibacillus halophilus]
MKEAKESLFSRVVKAAVNTVNDKPVVQKETVHVNKLNMLDIDTSSVNVKILIHEEQQIDVLLETYEDGPKLSVNDSKERVEISAKTERQISFSLFKNLPTCKMTVKLPRDIAAHWKVQTGSGKVTANGILADTVFFGANSGMVNISDVKANKLELKASSGRIIATNIKVDQLNYTVSSGVADFDSIYGDIQGSANSGAISMRNINSEILDVRASSGNINLEDLQSKKVTAKANSGTIYINRIAVEDADTTISSGNIKVFKLDGNLTGHANSGNINVELTGDSALDLRVGSGNIDVEVDVQTLNAAFDLRTNSGDIMADIPLEVENKLDRKTTGVVGEGNRPIKLQSRSGNIRIKDRR